MDERVFKRGFTDRIKYETETELRPIPGPLFSFSPFFSPPPWIFIEILHRQRLLFFFFFWEKSDPDESIFQTRGGYKIFIPGKHRSFLVFLLYIPRDQGPCFPLRGEGRGGEGINTPAQESTPRARFHSAFFPDFLWLAPVFILAF